MRIGVVAALLLLVNGLLAQKAAEIKAPIAVDKLPSGDLYALTQAPSVYRFHETEGVLSLVGSFSLPPRQGPSDISAVVTSNQPYLLIATVSQGQGYISQYTLDGTLASMWNAQHVPSGLDFDPKTDTIYAASADSPEIYEVSIKSREKALQYTGAVVGARQLGPVIVDGSRNRLLIGDVQNGEIYSFDLKARKSHLLASRLGTPQALLLSADGQNLFIADGTGRKIYRLSLSSPGATPAVFSAERAYEEPAGLALLSSGYIVVADDRANALFVLSPNGTLVRPH